MPPRSGRCLGADNAEATTTTKTSTRQDASSAPNGTAVPLVLASDASRRRDRIKLLLGSITETTEKLAGLIEAARDGEDHLVLGFASWTAYIAAEFSGLLSGLGAADRRIAVHALAASGMPTRAIAEVAGVNQSTIVRDQRQVMQDASPEGDAVDETFMLTDGSEIAVSSDELAMADGDDDEFEVALAAAREQGDLSRRNVVSMLGLRVTGRDGKSYPTASPSPSPAAPRPRRRPPLPDSYGKAVWDLGKLVDRLERLHADVRFRANRDGVSELNRGDLARRADQLRLLLADLDGGVA